MERLIQELRNVNPGQRILEIKSLLKETSSPTKINELVKELKILENLEKNGLTPVEAFTRQKVIIPPAVYRSPIELPNGTISIPDVNLLVKDIADISNTLERAKNNKLPKEDIEKLEVELYNALNDMSGFDPPKHNKKVQHNIFSYLAGSGTPKGGFVQKKLTRKRQDLSGRSTLVPDPSLDIDQVKLPIDMGIKIFEPFLMQEFKKRGLNKDQIEKEVASKSNLTMEILETISKDRPVLFNRAPSIRNTSVNTMYPIITRDKTISVPNLLAGLNSSLDFDGDQAAIHVPVSPEAVRDAQKLLPSRNLRWEPTNDIIAYPKHASISGIYMLSKSKEGQSEINKVLPAPWHISKQVTSKDIKKILLEIDKDGGYNTADIMKNLVKLGEDYTFKTGFTIGIDDLTPIKDIRGKRLSELKSKISNLSQSQKNQNKMTELYVDTAEKLTKDLEGYFKKNPNKYLGVMLNSKARGSASQFRDLVLTPLATLGGELTDDPIEHSYMEGLNPWEYWQASYGARRGIIGRAQDTAMPGALAQELLTTTNQVVIGDIETTYMKDKLMKTSDTKNIMDRIISKDVKNKDGRVIIKKDEAVTARVLQDAEKHKINELPIYTVIGSSNPDGSLPAKAYGLNKDGVLPEIGAAIGVTSAHGIVEPLFTSSMASFHTGSSLQDVESGYPRLKQLLELPKKLPKQAILSKNSGVINKITKDDLGGHNIMVGETSHYAPPNIHLKVKEGDPVEKGDILTTGPVHPQELAELKNLSAAQNYLLDELRKEVPNVKDSALEVVVESLTRYGEITDPGDSSYHHGDIVLLNEINEVNDELENNIKYKHVFKGVNTLPQAVQGPISKLNFRNLRREFKKSVIFGEEEDIHSYSPVIPIMKGEIFGTGDKGKY